MEASKIHEVLSKLEEKELSSQYKIFMDERKNKKDQLNILHQTRIQNIQQHAESKKATIEKKSQVKIDSFNNAIRNILAKEKDINNLIDEEKKNQDDEINSNLQITKSVSRIKKKKRKISPKNEKNKKSEKRVHFDESVFK